MSDTLTIPTFTLGDRMAKAREYADLSQTEMAEALGVSRRSVIRYEASTRPPKAMVIAYASITGVPLWWLLDEREPTDRAASAGYPHDSPLTLFNLAA